MTKITILGQTPSQKNGKNIFINSRTGKPFITSNSIVKGWQKDAAMQLMFKRVFTGPVKIDYIFYVKDNRKRDLDNMVASINDALVTAGRITGDHWQVLEIGSAKAALDKDYPRAELTIIAV